jgi:small GTP-binding protein
MSRTKEMKAELDPRYVEYLPFVSQSKVRTEEKSQSVSPVTVANASWLTSILSDLGWLALKGGIAYFSSGIYLLRYTKNFATLAVDIKNGNFDSILKRTFKNVNYTPKIKLIQKLITEKQDEQALELLNDMLVDLETIDDFEMRASLNILRAKLHYKNQRFLATAIYYMEAATLTSSQKLQKTGEGKEQASMNKVAMLYLLSLQSMALHLKSHEIDDNFHYLVADLAKRATALFDKEAEYREVDCAHLVKGGDIAVGTFNIPYPTFYIDKKSPELNRKLSLEVRKIEALIAKRELVQDLENYLEQKLYLEEDVDFLLEVSEAVAANETVSFECSIDFFMHLEKKMHASAEYNDSLSHLDIMRIQLRMKFGKTGESDLLHLFKMLDREKENQGSFLHLLALADKISTRLPLSERKEFASIILEKKYPFLTLEHIACYSKICDEQYLAHDPEINCLYSADVVQLKDNLEKLEVKDHAVIYKGAVEIISHQEFKELAIKKTKLLHPDQDLSEFGYILNADKKVTAVHDNETLTGLVTNLMGELHLRSELQGLGERLKNQKARIGIFGLTKVGKSTFLNTLIGKEILKSDRSVATNIVTIVKKSPLNKAKVIFLDKTVKEVDLEKIAEFTSEQGNPQNKKNVSRVEVLVNCSLPNSVEILDIPGFGVNEDNFHLHNDVIEECLGMVDGVFLVTTPNDGLKSFELSFIKKVTLEKKLPFILIANKMDEVDEDEAMDLKLGLKERLVKNGVPDELFPVFFISSQMGLSFIPDVDKARYFGMKTEEAQAESGLAGVYTSLKFIGERILEVKDQSILELLKHETEKLKRSLVDTVNDIELVQKSSHQEVERNLIGLKSCEAELEAILGNDVKKFEKYLQDLVSVSPEAMAGRLTGRIMFEKFSAKKEDIVIAEQECQRIFYEEMSYLNLMDETMSRIEESLQDYAHNKNIDLMDIPLQLTKIENEAIEDNLQVTASHFMAKLIDPNRIVINECKKIISCIKKENLMSRQSRFKKFSLQKESILQSFSYRIQNIDKARTFSADDFYKKLTYCREQIKLCNKYLSIMSNERSSYAS